MENLYPNGSIDHEPESVDLDVVLLRVDRLDKAVRKMSGKRKNGKKFGKKELKRRIEALEKENALLRYYLFSLSTQEKATTQEKPMWWQDALVRSAPNLVDMAASNFRNKK